MQIKETIVLCSESHIKTQTHFVKKKLQTHFLLTRFFNLTF